MSRCPKNGPLLPASTLSSILLPTLILLLVFVPACAPSPETSETLDTQATAVVVQASLEPSTATVGDRLRFSLVIDRDREAVVSMPEPLSDFAGLEVLDSGLDSDVSTAAPGQRATETYWYELRADQAGSYVVAPIELSFTDASGGTGTVMTPEVALEIASLLPADGSAEDIRDIKPLQRIPEPDWRLVALLAGLWLVLAAVLWRFVRSEAPSAAVRLLPHEIAFRELDRLRRTDFANLEALHAYYYAISSVIREYVEGRFGLNATDLTREEIVRALPSVAGLNAPQAASLERFLEATDEVKYARRLPRTDEIEANYELALRLVEETVPVAAEDDSDPESAASESRADQAGAGGSA